MLIFYALIALYVQVISAQLTSPCPSIFNYEAAQESETDRWYGVVSFSSSVELSGINIKVYLDRPSQSLVVWDHEARTRNNSAYNIFNPYHLQKAYEVVKVRIMVKYNTSLPVPQVKKIIINGKTECTAGTDGSSSSRTPSREYATQSSSWTTERLDPVLEGERIDFNEELAERGGADGSPERGGADGPPDRGGNESNEDPLNARPLSISDKRREPTASTRPSGARPAVAVIKTNDGGANVDRIVEILKTRLEQETNSNVNRTYIVAFVNAGEVPNDNNQGRRSAPLRTNY